MVSYGDMSDFGIISAKNANYVSQNKMESQDRTIMTVGLALSTIISKAALKNENEAYFTLDELDAKAGNIMVIVKNLFEDLGYDVTLEILSCTLDSHSTIYKFTVKW